MTATETALAALAAALRASPVLPQVSRDDVFERLLPEEPATLARALILRRGSTQVLTRALGDVSGERFELQHAAELEWYVSAPDEATRTSAFDAGLEAIAAVVSADPLLGGTVQQAVIEDPPDYDAEEWDNRPMLTARLTVSLVYTSPNPF